MKDRTENVYAQEMIGARLEVVDAPHEGYVGMKGKVIDETKKTFKVDDGRVKQVPKKGVTFEVHIGNHDTLLKGNRLAYRPHERIKRLS